MREVVLDTETTGLDPNAGHRVIEVGCLELHNHVPTGRTFHAYLNPEREIPAEAVAIHGLTAAFLSDKPRFSSIAQAFLDFVEESPLVIHNAEFDLGFVNAELRRAGLAPIANAATDTVVLARKKFPGAQASLDALCRRFGIDNSARTRHGALLDAELLAEVYLELTGGRQPGLSLDAAASSAAVAAARIRRTPRPHAPTADEQAAHEAYIGGFDAPLWTR
jgi:DNA polymerase-3 subunit epsilon